MDAYIEKYRERFGIEPMCRDLLNTGVQIASSIYYAGRNREPSARSRRDAELLKRITNMHAENLGVYGAGKIHAEIERASIEVARCTVEPLMRAAGLRGIPQ